MDLNFLSYRKEEKMNKKARTIYLKFKKRHHATKKEKIFAKGSRANLSFSS
jgi:hypothetical protein